MSSEFVLHPLLHTSGFKANFKDTSILKSISSGVMFGELYKEIISSEFNIHWVLHAFDRVWHKM